MSEEIQEDLPEETPPPLPAVVCVVEDYDAANPDHYAQWGISGKPDLPWQCTFYEDLQPDGETYVRRPQPQPPTENPLTDVERVKKQVNEEIGPLVDQRKAIIVDCRDEAAAIMLLKGYGYEGDEAIMRARVMAAGSQLYKDYAPEIKAFEDGASSQFYKSLENSSFDFLDLEYQDSNESTPTTIRSRLRAKMLPYLNPLSL